MPLTVSRPGTGTQVPGGPGSATAPKHARRRRSRVLAVVAAVVVAAAAVTAGLIVSQPSPRTHPSAGGKVNAAHKPTAAVSAPGAYVAEWVLGASPNTPAGFEGDGTWQVSALSCLPTGACALGDNAGDVAAPQAYPPAADEIVPVAWDTQDESSFVGIVAVSCPSAQFCVAADGLGNVMTYSNGSWAGPESVDTGEDLSSGAVDCPTTTFCALVDDDGDVLTYDGGSWSQPDLIDSNSGGSMSVSCASAAFCVAIDGSGNDFIYNGQGWNAGPSISFGVLAGISCASPDFCVATSGSADAAIFSGTAWITLTLPINADLISCPRPGDCMAADSSTGNTAIDQNSVWSQVAAANFNSGSFLPIAGLACWAPGACIAADGAGQLWRYHS